MKNYDDLCGRMIIDYRLDEYGMLINLILEEGIEVHAAGPEEGNYLEIIEY